MIKVDGRFYVFPGDTVTIKENWEYVERKKAGIAEQQEYENKGVVLSVVTADWSERMVCVGFSVPEIDPQWEPLERLVTTEGIEISGATSIPLRGVVQHGRNWLLTAGPVHGLVQSDQMAAVLGHCFSEYGCCVDTGEMQEDMDEVSRGKLIRQVGAS